MWHIAWVIHSRQVWNDKSLKFEDGKYYIPKFVLMWLLIAVLGSNSNIEEKFKNWTWAHVILEYKDKGIMISFYQYLWKKEAILELIEKGLWAPNN